MINIKTAKAKWLVACEEVKLYPPEQLLSSRRTLSAKNSSLQGLGRCTQFLIKLLLNWSESVKVMAVNNNQYHTFFLKLIIPKMIRNRYKGTQALASRHQGKILSRNGLVHTVLILRNSQVSQWFSQAQHFWKKVSDSSVIGIPGKDKACKSFIRFAGSLVLTKKQFDYLPQLEICVILELWGFYFHFY